MPEERAFLSAIMANPDDQTTKLVYADWLQERDDPREEIVRLKVLVDSGAEGWIAARARLTELESTVPARWLVMLNGPVWCVAGNIVQTRPFGPGGAKTRHGTRLFKPNAKIYLASTDWSGSILLEEQNDFNVTRIVGRHRKSVDWIGCTLRVAYTRNWRVELVYQPGALARLKSEGWQGFQLRKGEFVCPESKSTQAVQHLLGLLRGR